MKRRIILASTILSSLLFSAHSQPVALPPVLVTAPRAGGGDFKCTGTACSNAVNQESLSAHQRFLEENDRYPDEPLELDTTKVCRSMREGKPANCNYGSPPSVPGFDAAWTANGCGTGPRSNWFLSKVLSYASSSTYSGDLNAPFPGVSFLEACNSHDACWGSAQHRGTCDTQFRHAMESGCQGLSSPDSYNICTGYAGLYHGAVATTNESNDAYAQSISANACAAWVHDMKANGCNP